MDICERCVSTYPNTSTFVCLRCHKFLCSVCKYDHERCYGHKCELPPFTTRNATCIYHSEECSIWCVDCCKMVCNRCVNFTHKSHDLQSLQDVKEMKVKELKEQKSQNEVLLRDTLYQKERLEKELEMLNAHPNCTFVFPISQAVKEKVSELTKTIIENHQHLVFDVILQQLKKLKATVKILQEIQNSTKKALLSSSINCGWFVDLCLQHQKNIKDYTLLPTLTEDTPKLTTNYKQLTDEDLGNLLFCNGKGNDLPFSKEPTKGIVALPVDTSALHREIMDLKEMINAKSQEIQTSKDAIRLMTETTRQIYNTVITGQQLLSSQRPTFIHNYSDIEEMFVHFESYVQDFLKAVKEKKGPERFSEIEIRPNLESELKRTKKELENTEKNYDDLLQQMTKQEKEYALMQQRFESSSADKQLRTRMESKEKECLALQNQVERTQKENEDLKARINQVEKNRISMQQDMKSLQVENSQFKGRIERLQKELAILQKQIKNTQIENDDLRTRLSQVAGAKLVTGNSSIADLGDKNRPTKISEMYSELYDNEWTEAVEEVVKRGSGRWPEDLVARHLFVTLQACYKACNRIAVKQMESVVNSIFLPMPLQEAEKYLNNHMAELKQLKDARKRAASDVANWIAMGMRENQTFVGYLRGINWINEDIVRQTTKLEFFEKSVKVCWLMVVQDPEMVLDDDIQKGTNFNKDIYREYTKSGSRVLWSIWPALFLYKDGPLMTKGVAQACD